MKDMTCHRQQGAALVVGLVLLLVLTILAVSGVFTSTLELRMVRNTQSQERAFQSAEVAIENALANPLINTSIPEIQAPVANPNSVDDQYSYTLAHRCTTMIPVGVEGWGTNTASAYHFRVDASGTGPDNAVAQHAQGFYVVGPYEPDPEECDP